MASTIGTSLSVARRHLAMPFSPASRVQQWRYVEEKRDLRLDLLRGLAAAAMIIDHVGGADSWLYAISGGSHFYVSAAEGFVFISGLVMGMVYAGLIAKRGLRGALLKGARRVVTLYALATGLSLLFAAVSFGLHVSWAPQWTAANVLDFGVSILTLHRTYYLTDVLLLYTLAVAAALPALVLLAWRKGWLVLAASWTLWAVWQWQPDRVQLPWPIIDYGMFYFAAWQVLFLTGLVIGYHRQAWRAWGTRLGRWRGPLQAGGLVLTGAVLGGAIAFYGWAQAHGLSAILGVPLEQIFAKQDMRAGRLALFACLALFAFLLTTVAWRPIRKGLGWLLLPLGQDALLVYTLHLFVIVLLAEVAPRILGTTAFSSPENTLLQVLAIALLWALVQAKAHGGALLPTAYRKGAGWVAAGGRRRPAGATMSGAMRRLGGRLAAGPRLRPSGSARLGMLGVLLCGVVLIAEPELAQAFKQHLSAGRDAAPAAPVAGISAVPSAVGGLAGRIAAGVHGGPYRSRHAPAYLQFYSPASTGDPAQLPGPAATPGRTPGPP